MVKDFISFFKFFSTNHTPFVLMAAPKSRTHVLVLLHMPHGDKETASELGDIQSGCLKGLGRMGREGTRIGGSTCLKLSIVPTSLR